VGSVGLPALLPIFSRELVTESSHQISILTPFEKPTQRDPTGWHALILANGTHSSFLHFVQPLCLLNADGGYFSR
jgi:hypothetical protein